MSYAYFALSELTVLAGPLLAAAESGVGGLSQQAQPWRPPEWSRPALTMITVPAAQQQVRSDIAYTSVGGTPVNAGERGSPTTSNTGGQTVYVFDAVMRAEHVREMEITEHPIQTSSNSPVTCIADFAYQRPPRVTLDIGMSDAMQSYSKNMWSGNASKSVNAYKTLVSLMESRTLFTLTTRLDTYANMAIAQIAPNDTAQTRHGLRATVVFQTISLTDASVVSSGLVASSDDKSQPSSARAQTTGSTPSGTVQANAPSSGLQTQNRISSRLSGTSGAPVPGAGSWSSVNVNQLRGLLG